MFFVQGTGGLAVIEKPGSIVANHGQKSPGFGISKDIAGIAALAGRLTKLGKIRAKAAVLGAHLVGTLKGGSLSEKPVKGPKGCLLELLRCHSPAFLAYFLNFLAEEAVRLRGSFHLAMLHLIAAVKAHGLVAIRQGGRLI